jgi:hypothetical protein
MITFPSDVAQRVTSVVGGSDPLVGALAAYNGQTMSKEDATSGVCKALEVHHSNVDFETGCRIIGAIFKDSDDFNEMNERIQAGMSWSRNRFSSAADLDDDDSEYQD